MVRVSAFAIDGLTLMFRTSDHVPPHFHARKGHEWEIRVYIEASVEESRLMFDYKFPKNRSKNFRGLSSEYEHRLLDYVIEFRDELLNEWQQKVHVREVH